MMRLDSVRRPPGILIAVLCLLLSLLAQPALAQFRAGLQGTISDTTSAAVPGATVILTNRDTNQTRQVTSNPDGFYVFDRLAPGNYQLSAEANGFKKKVIETFTIAAEQIQGINVQLEVGAVSDTITVSGDYTPNLQTENATIDGTISNERILRLPQAGRDPYETVRLAPGVFGLGARTTEGNAQAFPNNAGPGGASLGASIFATENQVPISANGQRITGNNFEIDGVAVNSQAWGGAAVVTPNQESVKEIRVASSSYSAEVGRNTGALIQVVSQNGTNQFHGSFVTKFMRPDLNAFNRWNGPFGDTPRKVLTELNQYAGSFGGPIWRNKLFFFGSYETIRNSTTNITSAWTETPDYVQLVGRVRPNSIANTIMTFPNMTQQTQRILSRGCATTNLGAGQCADLPNGLDIGSPTGAPGQLVTNPAGGGLDGIADVQYAEVVTPGSSVNQQLNLRFDYQATNSDLIAFSLYRTPSDGDSLSGRRPAQAFTSNRRNTAGSVLWNHTITPTLLNEARFNVTRWFFDEIESNPDLPWGIPNVEIANAPFNFQIEYGVAGAGVFYQTTYNFRDILTKVIGSHNLKFGVDINREQNNDTVAWAARPSYNFGNLWNFANDVPIDETGNFDPRNGFPTDLKKYIRSGIYSLFVQDDWKIRPNLTLNLGLRWEYFTPLREKFDNMANLDLGNAGSTLTGASIGIGGDLYDPDRNNFGPQLGFAWSPQNLFGRETNNKVVFRGGYGIGFNRIPLALTLDTRLNAPFFGSFNLTDNNIVYSLGTGDITSFYGWPSNPATILNFNSANIPTSGAPVDIFGVPRNIRQPYSMRYSFETQYEVGANWVVAVGYQGSQGRKFPRRVNYSLFFEPNPRLNSVRFMQNDVNSSFNALLLRAQHRFARGFDISAQYRWSKSIDTCSNDNNCPQTFPFDQRTERGPSDYDVPHTFTLNGLWDLPIFGNRQNWTGRLLGGWQLNGVVTASTGFPWTPVYNDGNCSNITNRGGICPLRPIAYLGGAGMSTDNDTLKQLGGNFPGGGNSFFVKAPVEGLLPSNANLASTITPGIGRNRFRGPRYMSVDLSAVKRVSLPPLPFLGENAGVDLRANLFNVFNQLNLAPFGFDSDSTRVTNGAFGTATSALAGRVVEFQIRFSF